MPLFLKMTAKSKKEALAAKDASNIMGEAGKFLKKTGDPVCVSIDNTLILKAKPRKDAHSGLRAAIFAHNRQKRAWPHASCYDSITGPQSWELAIKLCKKNSKPKQRQRLS